MINNHVYVLTSSVGPVKIGVSIDPARRAIQCSRHGYGRAAVALSVHVPFFADLVEARAKQIVAAHCIRGEWFRVAPEDACQAVRQAVGEIVRRPLPAAQCGCVSPHVLTCAEARCDGAACDCECHTQRARGEWAPRIAKLEDKSDE